MQSSVKILIEMNYIGGPDDEEDKDKAEEGEDEGEEEDEGEKAASARYITNIK